MRAIPQAATTWILAAVASLSWRNVVFTNAWVAHAPRSLQTIRSSRSHRPLAVQKDPNDTAPPSSAAGRNETNKDSDSSSPPSLEKQVHMPKTAATPLAAKEETDKPATIPFQAIWGRTLDTVEDVVAHVRRIPYDLGWFLETPPGDDRERVIVLGSGWASHALLKVADPYRLAVFVVSPDNHFVFTPMLASAAVGTVEYRSMTEAVRAANPMIENYFQGQAIDVDVEKKLLKVQMNALSDDNGKSPIVQIPYDKLVVAVGCKVADDLVPGAKEFCLRLKTCEDSRQLRDGIGECLESASRPDVTEVDVAGNKNLAESEQERRRKERRRRVTFAIVGGGPTGVELCGELVDFCKDVSKPRVGAYPKLRDDIKVILIHGGPDLVPAFDEELRAHALRSLQKVGVDVRLNTKVIEVGSNFIKVAPKGAQDGQPEVIDVGLTVWAAGTAPVPFVDALLKKLPESARGKGGRINVDEWLRVPTPNKDLFGSILAMGDAVSFVDKVDSFLPQTAQVAGQQGAYAARLLGRGYDLEATPPVLGKDGPMMLNAWMKLRGLEEALGFDFVNLGLLAYVGSGEALTQIQIGDLPILSYAGSISFVLWRSVYFVKQVATRNRILVTFDWLKSAVFGRDITRL